MGKIIGFILITILALVCLQNSTSHAKANPNHTLRQKIFVHHPKPEPGRKPPKPPVGPTCTVTGSDQMDHYKLDLWHMPVNGLTYKINSLTASKGIQNNVGQAINDAFNTWTTADSKQKFVYGGLTSVRTAKFDGENVIAWKGIDSSAIAITSIWYWTDTSEVADVDTMFNKSLSWAVSPYSQDCIDSLAYDVQDIATHEFGHWVGLDDLYDSIDSELTMYGYGTLGELKKDTLGVGDKSGVLTATP